MALSELELSNEYNNCYFISLINVLNGIAEGAKLTKYGINDITSANCGIGKDGKIKIYDYSGFYE